MRTAVVTVTIGAFYNQLAQVSHPSIKAYADKINADFIVINEETKYPQWAKLKIYDLLKKYHRIIFLDSDILVRDDCPNLFDIVPIDSIGLFNENKFTGEGFIYMPRAMELYKMPFPWKEDPKYYNTGVMVMSRQHRHLLSKVPQHIMQEDNPLMFLAEQTYLNVIFLKNKIKIHDLHYKYNRMVCMDELTGESRFASYILHYAGAPDKFEMLNVMRQDVQQWKKDAPEFKYIRKILIGIEGGMGDQIAAEPVIRHMIEDLYPDAQHTLLTHFPRIVEHFAALDNVQVLHHDDRNKLTEGPYYYVQTIPKVETSELWKLLTHPLAHTVDFSAISVCNRLLPDFKKVITLQSNEKGKTEIETLLKDKIDLNNLRDFILVHPGKGWPSKTFPVEWWQDVVDELININKSVMIIGKDLNENQGYVNIKKNPSPNCIDLRDLLSLDGLIYLISQAYILISNDSAPIHIAGAFDNWIILLPTCKHPDHVLPYRNILKPDKYYKAFALYKQLTVDAIDSCPTLKVEGGQTLDYVVGDIRDYLQNVSGVIQTVRRIGQEELHCL